MTNLKRWTAQQLAEAKAYLEKKSPLTWSREDHYLALEFVIQRYLPNDSNVTQAKYDARLAEMKRKVDRNIGHPEEARNEALKEDAGFAAWLTETLRKRIERAEILPLLAHFDNDDEWHEQEKAMTVFKLWFDNPKNFEIDADLKTRIIGIMGKVVR